MMGNSMPETPPPPSDRLPRGFYPVMVTAFHEDGSIDWEGVDRITDFCITTGAAGLFAGGLSAEIDQMDDMEKVALADRIVRRAAGRVPVIAGAITSGPLEQQAELVRRIEATGADAVTISACQLADQADPDRVWLENAEQLLELIPSSVRLALYECPWTYWRLLSDATLAWVAGTDRFGLLKDTCCSIGTIRQRLERISGSRVQLFNANTQTLLMSLQAGADGFCGIGANYFPELFGWLGEHFDDQVDVAQELQQFLTSCCELTEGPFYPVVAKEYLQGRGVRIGSWSRRRSADLPAEIAEALLAMRLAADRWTRRLAV
jgi:4-hydroxy-tetrahydrodipicolinate synthase